MHHTQSAFASAFLLGGLFVSGASLLLRVGMTSWTERALQVRTREHEKVDQRLLKAMEGDPEVLNDLMETRAQTYRRLRALYDDLLPKIEYAEANVLRLSQRLSQCINANQKTDAERNSLELAIRMAKPKLTRMQMSGSNTASAQLEIQQMEDKFEQIPAKYDIGAIQHQLDAAKSIVDKLQSQLPDLKQYADIASALEMRRMAVLQRMPRERQVYTNFRDTDANSNGMSFFDPEYPTVQTRFPPIPKLPPYIEPSNGVEQQRRTFTPANALLMNPTNDALGPELRQADDMRSDVSNLEQRPIGTITSNERPLAPQLKPSDALLLPPQVTTDSIVASNGMASDGQRVDEQFQPPPPPPPMPSARPPPPPPPPPPALVTEDSNSSAILGAAAQRPSLARRPEAVRPLDMFQELRQNANRRQASTGAAIKKMEEEKANQLKANAIANQTPAEKALQAGIGAIAESNGNRKLPATNDEEGEWATE